MKFLALHENKKRGSFDFPLELYCIDKTHPRYEMPFYWHNECEILRVISGEFHLKVGETQIILRENDSIFIHSDSIHGGTPYDCVYECVVFSLDKILGSNLLRIKQYEEAFLNREVNFTKYNDIKKIEELFSSLKENSNGYEFSVFGIIMQIIGQIMKENYPREKDVNSKYTNNIKNVLRLIRNDYKEPISLEKMAQVAGLNHQYFCTYFKKITGKSPIDYLNYYRIECASEILLSTDLNITEIALECGFNDLSYFIKLFKRYKGVSPRGFKKISG